MKQALELLHKWSPMDVVDALELLTPAFTHPAVRKYAVTRLRHADDEVTQSWFLLLVQQSEEHSFFSLCKRCTKTLREEKSLEESAASLLS